MAELEGVVDVHDNAAPGEAQGPASTSYSARSATKKVASVWKELRKREL